MQRGQRVRYEPMFVQLDEIEPVETATAAGVGSTSGGQ